MDVAFGRFTSTDHGGYVPNPIRVRWELGWAYIAPPISSLNPCSLPKVPSNIPLLQPLLPLIPFPHSYQLRNLSGLTQTALVLAPLGLRLTHSSPNVTSDAQVSQPILTIQSGWLSMINSRTTDVQNVVVVRRFSSIFTLYLC
jgi:hypothetical protein